MQFGSKTQGNTVHQNLRVGDDNLEQVKEFLYLGIQINSINDISAKIKRRIYPANRLYCAPRNTLTSNVVSRSTKCI